MRQALLIVLIIAILGAAGAGAYLAVNSLVLSIYGYRSPLKDAPALSTELSSPLTTHVVVVLVDGLRYDTSLQMPNLNSLRQRGAQARLMASPPSTTQTSWVTLISGASPELNDMPLFDREGGLLQPLTIDHLFAAVRRAGGSVGIAGLQWWEKLIPPDTLDLKYFVNAEDDAADGLVVERALVFMQQFEPSLLLVNLRQVQAAGLAFGGDSAEYKQAALRTDEYIRRLAAQMDLQQSVLVVCSSHGQLAAQAEGSRYLRFLEREVPLVVGGYGGDEPVLLTTPLVLAGESVGPGDYGTLDQVDLAPLIASLLGAPIPSAAQGDLHTHMLRMELVQKAEKLVALAAQRLRIGDIYLYSIGRGTLTQAAAGDLQVAQSSMAVKNYEGAADLGGLSIEQSDREIARARRDRIEAEQLVRTPLAAAAVLLSLWLLWIRRSRRGAWTMLSAWLAIGLYHALFLWQGGTYSLSRMPAGGLAATVKPGLYRAALALAVGGLLMALWLWYERQRSFFAVIKTSYQYTLVVLYWIGLPIIACSVWNGPRFTWYIPSLTVAYVQFMLLIQAMVTAGLAVVLPLPVWIVQRLLLAWSDWRARARMRAPSIKEA